MSPLCKRCSRTFRGSNGIPEHGCTGELPRAQPTPVDYPCLCDDEWATECPQHVSCDIGCKALNEPRAAEEWVDAAKHWRSHEYIGGCSHGG